MAIDGWTADEIAALTVGDDTSALDAALAQAQAVFGDGHTVQLVIKLLDGDFTVGGKIGVMAGLSEAIPAEALLRQTRHHLLVTLGRFQLMLLMVMVIFWVL